MAAKTKLPDNPRAIEGIINSGDTVPDETTVLWVVNTTPRKLVFAPEPEYQLPRIILTPYGHSQSIAPLPHKWLTNAAFQGLWATGTVIVATGKQVAAIHARLKEEEEAARLAAAEEARARIYTRTDDNDLISVIDNGQRVMMPMREAREKGLVK